MNKPDILIFLSDQHHADYTGLNRHFVVRTPNLNRLAEDGTHFEAAYTACPLCVPARMSFLTGQLPSKTGIYSNNGAIPEDQATFLHSLVAAGYETVLCGRMHFMGEDQRHGFTKRIMGELTPLFWGRSGDERKDLGPYAGTLSVSRCLEVVGGGTSPVLEYDRAVIEAALQYLRQDHEKPQFLIVGTYAPHFSYVAPPDLFDYYLESVDLPAQKKGQSNYSHPLLDKRKRPVDDELMRKVRAAYSGMIENLDRQIGLIRTEWERYLQRQKRKGMFMYLSDHGDHAGEHDLYGKQTFYEGSAKIPLFIAGDGVRAGQRITGPVSMLDIGPTLCELTGATAPPQQDGKSLVKQLRQEGEEPDRVVISDFLETDASRDFVPARMVRQQQWKLISYVGYESYDLLFDLENDPYELVNRVDDEPQKYMELRQLLCKDWNIEQIKRTAQIKKEHYRLLAEWGKHSSVAETERWSVPEYAIQLPKSN